jgi:hypothetical protein
MDGVGRRAIAAGLLALGLASAARPATAETAASEPRALAVADRVMAALGGKERWDQLVGLRWSFESAVNDTVRPGRRHAWNKHTGWHRVEGTNRLGQRYCTVHSLMDSSGRAWVAGQPIEGDSLKKLIRGAYATWVNDSYWFLMPYKLRDPGAILKYDGEVEDSTGRVFDRLALSFQGVGLTPGDRYWIYVNRANHRIERWEYLLQGTEPPPVAWTWEGWEQHAGLWFPTAHRRGNRAILTRAVETPSAFSPEEFSAP